MPTPTLTRVNRGATPVVWVANHTLDRDEINPDTLIAATGLLIGALEGDVEASSGAANWETLLLSLTDGTLSASVYSA